MIGGPADIHDVRLYYPITRVKPRQHLQQSRETAFSLKAHHISGLLVKICMQKRSTVNNVAMYEAQKTLKPSSSVSQHDQHEPVTNSAQGNLSPSREIPNHVDFQ